MEPRAVYINSEQSFDLNKAIHCRQLKFDFFYEYELPRHVDPISEVLTPAFTDMRPGWYGVQGHVEVVALEKLLRDMVAKNFCGKRFVFEFHEKLTSKAQMNTCLRSMVNKKNLIFEHFDVSGL